MDHATVIIFVFMHFTLECQVPRKLFGLEVTRLIGIQAHFESLHSCVMGSAHQLTFERSI